jgi:hypothetical protein
MDILLYLTELLQTRKTVGIAGLGTLYKKKSPGKYDAEKHTFLPPSYTLAFTIDLKEQEELANYISSKRNITTDSANYYIGEFAAAMQTQLAETQEADLTPIGKLKFVNDQVILITDQENSFGFEFYGLPTLTEINPQQENFTASKADEIIIPETAEQEYVDEIEKNVEIEPVVISKTEESLQEIEEENKLEEENPGQETTAEVEENVLLNDEQETFEEITEVENVKPNIFGNTFIEPKNIETVQFEEKVVPEPVIEAEIIEIEEEEPKKGTPFLIKVLFILLFLIAAGAIAYFINPQFFNSYLKNFEGKPAKVVPIAPIDTLNTKTDTLLADSLERNNAMVNLATDTPTIDSSKITIYEVLVSAVATDKKANKIIANLAKSGVKAKKINLSKTMINISAGSFTEEATAKKYRDSLRTVLNNKGIYIQPINPKTHKK